MQDGVEEGGDKGGVAGGVVGGVVGAPVQTPAPRCWRRRSAGLQLLIDPNEDTYRVKLPPALERLPAGRMCRRLCGSASRRKATVTDVKVLRGADPAIDPQIPSVLRRWRYRPYTVNGQPDALLLHPPLRDLAELIAAARINERRRNDDGLLHCSACGARWAPSPRRSSSSCWRCRCTRSGSRSNAS